MGWTAAILKRLVVAFSDVFGFPDKPMHFTGKVKCKLTPLPGAPVPHGLHDLGEVVVRAVLGPLLGPRGLGARHGRGRLTIVRILTIAQHLGRQEHLASAGGPGWL